MAQPRPLTDRQMQVAELAVQGVSNKGIARTLGLTRGQVNEALKTVYRRTGTRSRWELMAQRRDGVPRTT